MKLIPFSVISEAQACDSEAVRCILCHFEGYIASQSLVQYQDKIGNILMCVDEDFRYQGEISLYSAIFRFRYRTPPEDFSM